MAEITDDQFDELVTQGIDAIPDLYQRHLNNVAFIVEDDPSEEQRHMLKLACNQTLLGLYEGTPLPMRGGSTKLLPDKITIFKNPILGMSKDLESAREQVKHTIWHEVAHYYGLDHIRIHELDGTTKRG